MFKKIVSFTMVAVMVSLLFATNLFSITASAILTEKYTLKVGEEKYLSFDPDDVREISLLDGFVQSTAWQSYGKDVSVVSQNFTSCKIRVNQYTTLQPIVVQCTVYYGAYPQGYLKVGKTAVDFEIYIEKDRHEHELDYYSHKSATHTSEGHTEYWYCPTCKKCFSDEKGLEEISKSSVVISKKSQHNYKATVIKPTATSEGYTLYKCECGASYKDNFVSKLPPSGNASGNPTTKAPDSQKGTTAPEQEKNTSPTEQTTTTSSTGIETQNRQNAAFLCITPVDDTKLNHYIYDSLGKYTAKYDAYEITSEKEGKEEEFNDGVAVTFDIPKDFSSSNIAVLSIGANGEIRELSSSVSKDGSRITAIINECGTYAVVNKKENHKSGVVLRIVLPIAAVLLLVVAAFVYDRKSNGKLQTIVKNFFKKRT